MPDDPSRRPAYAALGVPVHIIAVLRDRFQSARSAFDDMRDKLSDDAATAFDEWAAEGEKLFDSLEQRLRRGRNLVEEKVEEGTATIADVGRGIAETVTEPIIGIEAISGIGPSYASRLTRAGVVSTAALLERTRTNDALGRLATQTGISENLLTRWAAEADLTRIGGLGRDSMELLQILGVGTLGALAEADPAELHRRAATLRDRSPRIDRVPGSATITAWIEEARSWRSS